VFDLLKVSVFFLYQEARYSETMLALVHNHGCVFV
jgi:hypothetical protein